MNLQDKASNPELPFAFRRRGRRFDSEKYYKIKGLIERELTASEITNKMGYFDISSLLRYLRNHPELPRPILESSIIYDKISKLIERGFNQSQIANHVGYSRVNSVSSYLRNYPELLERYWEIKRQRGQQK